MKKISLIVSVLISSAIASNFQFESFKPDVIQQKNNIIKKTKITQLVNDIKNKKTKFTPKIQEKYDSSTLIIEFKKDITLSDIKNTLNNLNSVKYTYLKHLSDKSKFVIAKFKTFNKNDIKRIYENLKNNPFVEKVEYNYINKPLSLPNDPMLNDEWHIKNIKADKAWDKTTGSKNTVVAVFDTGISLLHEDLKDNIDTKDAYDFATNDNGDNGPLKGDLHPIPHGSHVSGIVGAVGNNGIGISGVNQKVTILPLKVFRPSGYAYNSDILEAIDYLIDLKKNHNLNVVAVNASYGGFGGDADNSPMKDALKKLGDNGIMFFAAAGNSGIDNDRIYYDFPALPASYNLNNVIAVAASDQNNKLTWFSQFGKKTVQVAAPGIDVLSTVDFIDGNDTNSEYFKDDFETQNNNWYTNANWSYTTADYHSPSHSLTDSPNGNYDDSQYTYTVSPEINIDNTSDKNLSLDFCMNLKLADGDYFVVYFYNKNDNNFHYVYYTSGKTDGWKCIGIPIEDRFKSDKFKVAFAIAPNGDGNSDDGVYIDDVKVGTYSKTNMYEKWAGTSMATPVVTGSYALLSTYFKNETPYQKLSRIINKGEKLDLPIAGDKIDLEKAFSDNNIPPLILNTKKALTLTNTDSVTINAVNFNNPKAYIGDTEVKILKKSSNSLTLELPKKAQNKIILKENGVSNPLYISFWNMLKTKDEVWYPYGSVNGIADNKLYVVGYNAFEGDASIKYYDLKNNNWKTVKTLNSDDIRLYSSGAMIDNNIYVIGGLDANGNTQDTTLIYNIKDGSSSNGANMPKPLYLTNSLTDGKNIYTFSGLDDQDNINKDVYKYSPKNDNWEKIATIPNATYLPTTCLVNNKIYIFGGGNDQGELTNNAYALDINTNKISTLANMPIKLIAGACAKLDNEHIMIFSGVTEDNNIQKFNHSLLIYDIKNNKYEEIKNSAFSNLLDRATFGTQISETKDAIYYPFGFNEYIYQTTTIEKLDKNSFYNLINKPSNGGGNNGGGSGGGAPISDIFTLLLLLGAGLFLRRK